MNRQNIEIARLLEEKIVDLSSLSQYSKEYITSRSLIDVDEVFRLAVLSNYSTQYIEMGLPLFLASRGINAQIGSFDYNSWRQQIVDVESDVSDDDGGNLKFFDQGLESVGMAAANV